MIATFRLFASSCVRLRKSAWKRGNSARSGALGGSSAEELRKPDKARYDEGPELVPRLVANHPQLALHDDRLREVKPLVTLALGKLDGARHARRSRCLKAETTVVLIDQRV